jgi:hypothetical protein
MTRLRFSTIAFVIAAAGLLTAAGAFAQDPRGGGGNHPGSSGSQGGAVHSGGGVSSPGGSLGSGSSSSSGGGSNWSSPSPSGGDRRGGGDGSGRAVTRWRAINERYGSSGSDSGTDANRWYSRERGTHQPIGKAIDRGTAPRPGTDIGPWTRNDGWGPYGYDPLNYGHSAYLGYYGSWPYYRFRGNCGPMYGFGAYGLGYYFFDPLWWAGTPSGAAMLACDPYDYYASGAIFNGYPGYGYGYGSYSYGGGPYGLYSSGGGYSSGISAAGLKLKVKPSSAKVYVDGYFAGTVDEFDSVFQRLPLNPGSHHIDVSADGYTTLSFDISAEPYQTINYRGELKRSR